ncbi:MAG: hypothetical protein BWX80_03146 [Candidatus Hydrogenedentes bacterium ADurb.Bin101]|nr:MAG: hypothetical protein BWX80_03146 [Candidatus Hydrogenedentes bacterium ADurb.Bin101]
MGDGRRNGQRLFGADETRRARFYHVLAAHGKHIASAGRIGAEHVHHGFVALEVGASFARIPVIGRVAGAVVRRLQAPCGRAVGHIAPGDPLFQG